MEKLRPTFTFTEDLLRQLQQVVPEAFADGKINWETLREALGEHLEDETQEHFGLTWPGKREARRLAALPPQGTLVPAPGEGVDEETTHDIFIEGENLEVLKLLQKSYAGRIKMIYIDPPYNTGNDYIYEDDYSEPLEAYLKRTGQMDEAGHKLTTNTRASGRFHSRWLSMMYPRLLLARQLLREDGVIFVSIDDNEVHHLRQVMNEVFGEENFVACLPTIMNLKGNNDQYGFAGTHEYTIVFVNNKEAAVLGEFELEEGESDEWEEDEYGYYKKGANLKATGKNAPREKRPHLFFPLYYSPESNALSLVRESKSDIELLPITDGKEMSWRWGKRKFSQNWHNLT